MLNIPLIFLFYILYIAHITCFMCTIFVVFLLFCYGIFVGVYIYVVLGRCTVVLFYSSSVTYFLSIVFGDVHFYSRICRHSVLLMCDLI